MIRILISTFWLVMASAWAAVDLDADGYGDIWRMKYPGAALAAHADTDGDGQTNAAEAVIGTNPYDSKDVVRIGAIQKIDGNFHISWDSLLGKRYLVEASSSLAAPSWSALGTTQAGTGESITAIHPAEEGRNFFRVRIFDVDTDNDGISDWEETQAGFDPNENHVHACGCGDSCGCGPGCTCGGDDLARLTHALQSPSVVTIEAVDAESSEPDGVTQGDQASFRIRRQGGLGPITVSLGKTGAASNGDHAPVPESLTLPMAAMEATVSVSPLADALVESDESVILTVLPGSSYTPGSSATAAAMIHDRILANGTGLLGNYWDHPNTTRDAPYFNGPPHISRIDSVVNFNSSNGVWPGPPVSTATTSEYFSSRWSGEILPEFTQVYTIYYQADSASRLWINDQMLINNWPPAALSTSEKSAVVSLIGGKRYPIVLEHFNNSGGHVAILSWKSANQTKQVIPQTRLFPSTAPQIYGPYEEWAFVGAPSYQYQISASGSPTAYSAAPLPAGFTFDTNTGLLTGNPLTAGTHKIAITATNVNGSGSAILTLHVIENSGGITRELWNGVPGSSVDVIPTTTPPSSTSLLTSLNTLSNSGDDYGARIRGFLTAPATGEYRFFLRADQEARFLLSDDEEPVNAWVRAELKAPAIATDWSEAASSPLLHLEAGRRYYLEILHKESSGDDHLSLAWAKPDQDDTTPSEIIPGHLLTRFEDMSLGSSQDGALYFAQLVPQSGAVTNGYGTCTLRLSADKTTAWVTPEFANLGSTFTGMHVHDTRLPSTSNIVFDPDEPGIERLADGSYVWHIQGVGGLTAEQVADGIGQTAYYNIHTTVYPGGEIKGFFRLLDGSSTFTPPPPAPDWSSEPLAANSDVNAASRFLQQSTFGANTAEISALQALPSYDAWIESEFNKPATYHRPYVEQFRNVTVPSNPTYPGTLSFNSWWKNSIEANDQLRQRVAFALHEIMVISESGPLDDRANAISDFYDMLLDHSFGNVRDLLEQVTLHPAMGRYLDMLRNDKPNLATGLIPNENYAREILQLFSLGLNRMHPDGSLILSSKGLPIPVYDQEAIVGFAHGFTGWDYGYTGSTRTSFNAPSNWVDPMRVVPARHYVGKKRLLNNVVLPGLDLAAGVAIDPFATHTTAQINDPAYQQLGDVELEAMHDQIFQHPNFGPFFCRQLIQRLVTSTPSRGYIYRVTSKFNDNGSGTRGDMKAVIKAILLDYEARSITASNSPGYGKQREPVNRVTQLVRAFRPTSNFAGSAVQDGGLITIDTAPTIHRLATNQKVLLGFTSAGTASNSTDYSVLNATSTSFTVRTKDIHRSTWSQNDTVITVTTPSAHGFTAGQSVYLRFRDAVAPPNDNYVIATIPSTTTFTIVAAAASGSGTCDVAWARGGYSQVTPSGGSSTLTITCAMTTGLQVGNKIDLMFTPTTGQTTTPPTDRYTITSVNATEPRAFTVTPDNLTLPVTSSTLSGSFHGASTSLVLAREGPVVSGYSDWNVGSTDTDLGQTPLRSPTVFNYYLPDYQHPGLLANSGLVTPEFQISSDTNVIRQANFLFGGIYSSSTSVTSGGYANGFSSFRTGSQDMMMDFSPWMGPRTSGTDYWTNTGNLRFLIRELSKLLMAGRMSTALEDQIFNFVSSTSNITYSATTPSESERRNRVRSIVYFIAVSPEHAIQR